MEKKEASPEETEASLRNRKDRVALWREIVDQGAGGHVCDRIVRNPLRSSAAQALLYATETVKAPKCGTQQGYFMLCRCDECRAYKRSEKKAQKDAAKARRAGSDSAAAAPPPAQ